MHDPYQTLDLPKTASAEEITSAYRKLSRKYHPDLNPGDEKSKEKFLQVKEAYELLSDPSLRKAYDSREGIRLSSHTDVLVRRFFEKTFHVGGDR